MKVNLNIEKDIIGILLWYPEHRNKVFSWISQEMLTKREARETFEIIRDLHNTGETVDIVSVMRASQNGKYKTQLSPSEISDLGNLNTQNLINLKAACLYIREQYASNYFSKELTDSVIDLGSNPGSIIENMARVHKAYQKVSKLMTNDNIDPFSVVAQNTLNELIHAKVNKIEMYIPTGFPSIDREYNILRPTNLVVLAGRPGMGKTAWVICLIIFIAFVLGKKVRFNSLEMTKEQVIYRILSILTGIHSDRISNAKFSDDEQAVLQNAIFKLNDRIIIDDESGISIEQYSARVARSVEEDGIEIAVCDYLQLLHTQEKLNSTNEKIGEISKKSKQIAKENNIPLIQISQMSREAERRDQGKDPFRPKLSDLRDSGSIEQDADVVCFLFRPEYYKLYRDDLGNDLTGKAEFIIAKNRHGAIGSALLNFDAKRTQFKEIENESTIITNTNNDNDEF